MTLVVNNNKSYFTEHQIKIKESNKSDFIADQLLYINALSLKSYSGKGSDSLYNKIFSKDSIRSFINNNRIKINCSDSHDYTFMSIDDSDIFLLIYGKGELKIYKLDYVYERMAVIDISNLQCVQTLKLIGNKETRSP